MYNRYMQRICKHIATLGPIGYLPAPGTCGTVASFPILYGIRTYIVQGWGIDERIVLALICLGAGWCISQALPLFSEEDPSEIVIDELAGFAVTLYMMPFAWPIVFVLFVLFRVYDILKMFHVDAAQQMPGALGVVIDDVIAGIFANITFQIMMQFIV